MAFKIDFTYMVNVFPKLIKALPVTFFVVLVVSVISVVIGTIVTVIRLKKIKGLFQVISVYVSFVRGTPCLIQLFVIYYGLPLLVRLIGIDINPWSRITFASLTLILHVGAHFSEIIRPAYLAIDKGQHDAANSIGLTGTQKTLRIICPQVIPIALPSLGNLLIDLIKDTSILFTIGVVDLMGSAKLLIAQDYGVGKLEVYIAVAVIYWIISIIIEKEIGILEKRSEKCHYAKGIRV